MYVVKLRSSHPGLWSYLLFIDALAVHRTPGQGKATRYPVRAAAAKRVEALRARGCEAKVVRLVSRPRTVEELVSW